MFSFAREYSAPVTVVHVSESAESEERLRLENRVRHEVETRLARDLPPSLEPECLVETGDPAHTILQAAERRGIDLIVLGVRKTPRWTGHS